ncbi:MAG: hypothetical protein AVDCRST_MAG50-528, partial [uncultured Acidimicrobiales bacterium]
GRDVRADPPGAVGVGAEPVGAVLRRRLRVHDRLPGRRQHPAADAGPPRRPCPRTGDDRRGRGRRHHPSRVPPRAAGGHRRGGRGDTAGGRHHRRARRVLSRLPLRLRARPRRLHGRGLVRV